MMHLSGRRPSGRPGTAVRSVAALATTALATVALLLLASVPAAAQEGTPEMSAEQQAMMEAWVKSMTPGEPHSRLAEYAGDYTMTVKTWMDPAGEPEVSEGKAHYEMIMGGRFLQETVDGSMMGQPFRGLGLTGYDNVKGHYWSTWVDNMSTGVITGHGDHDAEAGGLVMRIEYADPATGAMKKARTLTRHQDDGRIVFEWFEAAEGGGEAKTMEIVYRPAS